MKGYDYAQPGAYFVTLVAWQKECQFGKIVDGSMQLNELGYLAQSEWRRLVNRFEKIQIDEFVVMPNHLHGIIIILDSAVGARREVSTPISGSSHASPLLRLIPGSLGAIVGAYKSWTTRLINGIRHTASSPVWQRNYYERIIRNNTE